MSTNEQPTTDPRAAQVQAVRDVLALSTNRGDGTDNELDQLAVELVDAVHAAGRDGQDESEPDTYEPFVASPGETDDPGFRAILIGEDELERLAVVRERLDLAKRALIRTGYFTDDQVSDDIAPRITEMFSALNADQGETRIPADQVGAYADGWAAAIKTLLDTAAYKRWHQQVYATTGVDHQRWNWNNRVTLADYLEAVGPDGTARGGIVTHPARGRSSGRPEPPPGSYGTSPLTRHSRPAASSSATQPPARRSAGSTTTSSRPPRRSRTAQTAPPGARVTVRRKRAQEAIVADQWNWVRGDWIPPRGNWASGGWQALAITLAQPLRKAFADHLNAHGCGAGSGPTYIGGFANCPEATALFDLLPDGDRISIG